MARDGQIDMSYVPTAEMLADRFTQLQPKTHCWVQCDIIGRIRSTLGKGLRIGIGNCDANSFCMLGNHQGNGITIGNENAIGNAIGKYIELV